MALAPTAAAVAGTAAAAAYLEAKLHIKKDLRTLYLLKKAEWDYIRAEKANRQSCFSFFEEAVNAHPSALAIWSRSGTYTWREAHDRVCQYAAYFLSLGVRPGQLVAFCLQNSPEFVFGWLGLWAIGCAPAMINFNLGGDALVHCLKISGAKIVLVDADEAIQGRMADVRGRIVDELGINPVVLIDPLKQAIAASEVTRPDDSYRQGVKGSFPAALLFTSGTTGFPKGAIFDNATMYRTGARRTAGVANQRRGPGGDRWYICMPMYHGTGGIAAMTAMMAGVSVAIGKGFSVRKFWNDVRDSESTFITYVGETARYLLAAPPSPLDKYHKVRCMYGNGLRPDVWERFRERFGVPEVAEFFNSSEGMFSLFVWNRGPYSRDCVGHHGVLMRSLVSNIFVPVEVDLGTYQITRDDRTGWAKRKSYDEGGEILVKIRNEKPFLGYWNNPEATQQKLIRDVFTKGDIYYRTGDVLRRTDDGRWFFMDRLGDTYRWKSENVSTAEVAEVIGRVPGIVEANVYGVTVPGHEGKAGCAALTIDPEHRKGFDWRTLADQLNQQLPKYAVPVFLRILEGEVGHGASHTMKQDKVKLRAEGIDPEEQNDEIYWIPPKGDTYVRLKRRDWQSLVGGVARL